MRAATVGGGKLAQSVRMLVPVRFCMDKNEKLPVFFGG